MSPKLRLLARAECYVAAMYMYRYTYYEMDVYNNDLTMILTLQ